MVRKSLCVTLAALLVACRVGASRAEDGKPSSRAAARSGAALENEQRRFQHLRTLPLDFDPQVKAVPVADVAWSPDGRFLAAAMNDTVDIFDVTSGVRKFRFKHDREVFCVAFSPDGKVLATGGFELRFWDLAQRQSQKIGDYGPWVEAIAFSPDGRSLAVGASRANYAVLDLQSGQVLASFDPFDRAGPIDTGLYKPSTRGFAFSANGRTLAAYSDFFDDELPRLHRIQVCDLDSHDLIAAFAGEHCLMSHDGKRFVCGAEGKIQLLNPNTFRVEATLESPANLQPGAMTRDGQTLAAIADDKSVQLWDLVSCKRLAVLHGHAGRINAVVFSPDGTTLASGSADGSIRLWAQTTR